MRGSLGSVAIAISNSPSKLPLFVIPAVLLGWVSGVVLLPSPRDQLVAWLSLLAIASGLTAFAGHFVDALSLQQKYPPLVVLGGLGCFSLSLFCLWHEPSVEVFVRVGLPLLLATLVWFYSFYFSVFHGREMISKVRIDDKFPNFSLIDSDGRLVTLASIVANGPALLLFYKGDW